jgi:succinylglutamate desuccinylase
MKKRIIGEYEGKYSGTLIFAIAALHGNEAAGVEALKMLFQLLEAEPHRNPNFTFSGKIIGLLGNVKAYERKVRYLVEDLNRIFYVDNVQLIQQKKLNNQFLNPEEEEVVELLACIDAAIAVYQPKKIYFIDLHTTSADGGIFSIPYADEMSIALAKELGAPVVSGLAQGLGGTTVHFFKSENFNHIPTTTVAFEAGQHDDPLSIRRAVAALIHALRAVGLVQTKDVESHHETVLQRYARQLPKVVDLLYVHRIRAGDAFQMLPNFKNFQAVQKGQPLARDIHGWIFAPEDALILMPLYQKQGSDGFFLVKEVF